MIETCQTTGELADKLLQHFGRNTPLSVLYDYRGKTTVKPAVVDIMCMGDAVELRTRTVS